jgi:peptide methionine sulfoxide reductase msrA/msrB
MMHKVLALALVVLAVGAMVIGSRAMDKQSDEARNDMVRVFDPSTGEVETVRRVVKSDAEWQKLLTPEQFRVTRQKGTEPAFSATCGVPAGAKKGTYECVGCGTALFGYGAKFESGTGWPSFFEPISELNIRLESDNSHGMSRTEVLCARCGAHLGHVFNDGPPPTHKRFCINAVALRLAKPARKPVRQKATFAAGCFWGVESAFRDLIGEGVISTRVGYTGGHFANPSYEDVCSDKTGHAESVEVTFDPKQMSYKKLLDTFSSIHDPTTPNRQGPDYGSQYRSAIFYHTPEQKKLAEESKRQLEASGRYKSKIVTEIAAAGVFYPAEEYHQRYFEKRGEQPACHLPTRSRTAS